MTKYAILLVVVGWAIWRWTPATFSVRNESGQPIRTLTVEVEGKMFRFEEIPVGGVVSATFQYGHEASLDVWGRLADGTEFHEFCGYVVWEDFAPHVDVVVQPGGRVGVP